ncbi:hypothetical protein A7A78_13795 [Aequorivita soesokkakensis]|uniref:Uncharacterized protein n=1 Tax=Aequorivita soesokkakensis TaxID=1385699 RepID=A0A1A9LDF3_9FLAO|nr:hypothetical protein [Aequorivita soesokkakensis]OAD90781.1 hypothetical protein A7A78_13795 [Aequorivita soesokkakensis]
MKFTPSVKIELTTLLSQEEVRKALTENLQPKEIQTFIIKKPKTDKIFEGYFHEDCFQIQRIITGKNSFLPQINGRIAPHLNGTKLIAELKLPAFVVAFMILWVGVLSLGFILSVVGSFNHDEGSSFIVIPLLMVVFGIGMAYFGFTTEKNKAITELKKILKAQTKQETHTI